MHSRSEICAEIFERSVDERYGCLMMMIGKIYVHAAARTPCSETFEHDVVERYGCAICAHVHAATIPSVVNITASAANVARRYDELAVLFDDNGAADARIIATDARYTVSVRFWSAAVDEIYMAEVQRSPVHYEETRIAEAVERDSTAVSC
jgi:hypothetical protein